MTIVELKNIKKTFGKNETATEALKGISLKILEGD